MSRGPNPIKVQGWTERLARFRKSDLSVARFCDAEGVSTASFYHWQRKLPTLVATSGQADSKTKPRKNHAAFHALQVTSSAPSATSVVSMPPTALTIFLADEMVVQVADNPAAIAAVMRELVRSNDPSNDSCGALS